MDPHPPLHAWCVHVDLEPRRDAVTLVIRGRLGTEGTSEIRSAVQAAISAGGHVDVDLSGVDYISSAGLVLLHEAAHALRERGREFRITAASDPVTLALRLGGDV